MADILIKGMKMPKNLYGAHIIIKPNGDVQDYLNGAVFAKAIELPPHGRLIDADAEIKAWEQTKTALKECDQKRTFAFKEACIAVKVLSDAPTVLEASNG